MKKRLCLLVGVCALVAGTGHADLSASGAERCESELADESNYTTPGVYEESGRRSPAFIPHNIYVEHLGRMSLNGGGGRVQVTNAAMSLTLIQPQQVAWKGWQLDAKARTRLTRPESDGRRLLDDETLCTIGLQAGLTRAVGSGGQLHLGALPQYSADGSAANHHAFYWGGYATYSARPADSLHYTIGLACMPDSFRSIVLPILRLHWRCHPAWELRAEGARLSATCVADEHFHWGPFLQWNMGVWTVQREGRTRQFRMNNAILGIGASYELEFPGGGSLSFLGDGGCSFCNTFRMRDAGGEHTLEKHRAHPGLYGRFGLRLQF